MLSIKKSNSKDTKSVSKIKGDTKSQQSFRSELHNLFKETVNKILFSANDDKRLYTFDLISI